MNRPLVHVEPFVHLVDVSHDRALVAWGAFWFQRSDAAARWEIVDDQQLHELAGRRTCIGSSTEPFGDSLVEASDAGGRVVASGRTSEHCWAWLEGLQPDTEYEWEVLAIESAVPALMKVRLRIIDLSGCSSCRPNQYQNQ